jgi:hypothetical protein
LSTLEVMMPGPIIARKIKNRRNMGLFKDRLTSSTVC